MSNIAPVLEKTYQFLVWLLPTVEKFPRAHKFTLGERTQALALTVLEGLIEANYRRERGAILAQVNMNLEKLRFFVSLGK